MTARPVVIITGAAGGIGAAMALKYASKGYALTLVDIDAAGLKQVEAELQALQSDYLLLTGDLQEQDFLHTIVNSTVEKWKRIDVLVNNAAWRTRETMRTISPETWEKTWRVCITAPAFLTKYTAEVMEQYHIPGVIINVSSIQSSRAGAGSPAYTSCKGALESLTYELAALYGPKGIRVVAINPGNINTSLSADFTDTTTNDISNIFNDDMKDNTPLQRAGDVTEIADVAYWLSSGEASFITGTTILADGGFLHNFLSYPLKKLQFPKEF
ncbi:SDR family oxidoreductase [Chitinophaga sp. MM2321]|uniref:SDR family NAD(P)-dependent oxidoreductase n=1 Tax=Chitinophaga sp. MM2321 TaxID=3137178 RepID=UPI0032D56F15